MALLSAGVLLSASAAPTESTDFAGSKRSPAVVVPDVALTIRATPESIAGANRLQPPNLFAANGGGTGVVNPVVPLLPPGTDPDSSTPVTLDSTGIPARALEAYRLAATLTDSADPGCKIDWALIAAIGKVESNHARFGGNQLDAGAVAQPGIIGIALDGTNGTARITDTDGGLLDRDTTFDRAVGPMQFIPGTWRAAGVDADGDGAKNPQDMADAATASAIYLCSGPGDLSTPGDLRSAILRYNYSDSYVRMVSSIAAAYRNGVSALPASDLAPEASPTANSESATSAATAKASDPAAVQSVMPAPPTTTRPSSTTTPPATTPRPPAASASSTTPAPPPSTSTAPVTPSSTSTTTPVTPSSTSTTTPVTPSSTSTTTPVTPSSTSTTTPVTPSSTTTTGFPTGTVTCEPTPTGTATITPSPTTPAPCVPAPCPSTPPATADVSCVDPTAT